MFPFYLSPKGRDLLLPSSTTYISVQIQPKSESVHNYYSKSQI